MFCDALFGSAYVMGGTYNIILYYGEEYIPWKTKFSCFFTPHIQVFTIVTPTVGLISLANVIDRLLSVFIPIRYFQWSTKYSYTIGAIVIVCVIPIYVAAFVDSYNSKDVLTNGLCLLQHAISSGMYSALRLVRISSSITGVLLYIPIFGKLKQIIKTKHYHMSEQEKRRLSKMTFTVSLITLNELILFTVPDIYVIIETSSTNLLFFLMNLNKGVINMIPSYCMVLRFNEKGLHELAVYTRTWMNQSISSMAIESYTHKIHKGIAAGDLNLENIKVSRFFPPLIRYRSSDHGLYMTTLGGQAEIRAEWELDSNFLSLFSIPFKGDVQGRIAGLRSEISVKINPDTNEFEVHHCIAKFDDFRIRLSGSIAADILHWFRAILGKAMKKRVEETYCRMILQKLLPWLQYQLAKFPSYLQVNFGENIQLSQSLHSIVLSSTHVDLRMKNKFMTNGHLIETLSTLPSSYPEYERNRYRNQKMLELFIDEPTLQEIISAAHFSEQFRSNMTSPFLRTECEMLCLGTLFPELQAELGPTKLIVEVKTLTPPIIRLSNDRAFVFINSSVEIFDSNLLNSTNKPENDIIDNIVDIINPVLLDPVISIEVSGEAELFVRIDDRKLSGKLKLRNTRAIVLESKLTDVSQKTVDFIVNLSIPFLEDAIQVFLGQGTPVDSIFKVNTRNETLTIHDGFIRLQTDLIMEEFLD